MLHNMKTAKILLFSGYIVSYIAACGNRFSRMSPYFSCPEGFVVRQRNPAFAPNLEVFDIVFFSAEYASLGCV